MTSSDHELHHMVVGALTIAETIDVTNAAATRTTLDRLEEHLRSIRQHMEIVETLVLPVLDHAAPGSTGETRELHGMVDRGLLLVRERIGELEVALEEQRSYCDELAVDLYLAIASVAVRTAKLDRTWTDLTAAA